jgi:hypothetical protein
MALVRMMSRTGGKKKWISYRDEDVVSDRMRKIIEAHPKFKGWFLCECEICGEECWERN